MRNLLPLSLAMMAACHAVNLPAVASAAVAGPVIAPIQLPTQRVRERPDTVVDSYSQSLKNDRALLLAKGLAADHVAIRAIVDANLPLSPYLLQAAGATQAVQRRLRVDSVTNNLLNYGYRRIHFRNAAQVKRLVSAAAGVFGSSADSDLATFAPTIAIAELSNAVDAADGSSALVYRVVEAVKNAPAAGKTIRLTLNGPRAPSPFPPPPQPGEGEMRLPGRVVLFLSPQRAIGIHNEDAYSRITQPMRLDGEKLTAGYHSDAPEITLTRLRAVIRKQVCAASYVAVGARGTGLRC